MFPLPVAHDDFEDRPSNYQSDVFLVFNFHPTQQVGSTAQDSRLDSMTIFQSWEPFCHKGKNCFYCSKFKTLNPNIFFVEYLLNGNRILEKLTNVLV